MWGGIVGIYRELSGKVFIEKMPLCRVIKEVWIYGGKRILAAGNHKCKGTAGEAYPKYKDQLRGQYTRAEGSRGGRDSRRGQGRMGTRSWRVLWPYDIIDFYSE